MREGCLCGLLCWRGKENIDTNFGKLDAASTWASGGTDGGVARQLDCILGPEGWYLKGCHSLISTTMVRESHSPLCLNCKPTYDRTFACATTPNHPEAGRKERRKKENQ